MDERSSLLSVWWCLSHLQTLHVITPIQLYDQCFNLNSTKQPSSTSRTAMDRLGCILGLSLEETTRVWTDLPLDKQHLLLRELSPEKEEEAKVMICIPHAAEFMQHICRVDRPGHSFMSQLEECRHNRIRGLSLLASMFHKCRCQYLEKQQHTQPLTSPVVLYLNFSSSFPFLVDHVQYRRDFTFDIRPALSHEDLWYTVSNYRVAYEFVPTSTEGLNV